MVKAAELQVIVGADTSDFEKKIKNVENKISTFGKNLTKVGKTLTIGITTPLLGAAAGMLKVGMEAEKTSVAFGTLLGSTEKANQMLKDLADFAAKTPFGISELEDAARMMMAYGFAAEDIVPMLRKVGDAVAGLGLSAEGVDRVIRALGQMQAKGKVAAQEMMQLAEVGIPAWRYLAEAMGMSISDVMKVAETGSISASKAIDAILQGMEKDFGGMMEKQSKTASGALSNLKDELVILGRELSVAFLPTVTMVLNKIIDLVRQFNELPNETKMKWLQFAGIVAIFPPILTGIGKLIEGVLALKAAIIALTVATIPWQAQLLGITALIVSVGVIINQVKYTFTQWADAMDRVSEAWSDFMRNLGRSARSAGEALDIYNQRQVEVQEKAGLLGKFFNMLGIQMGFTEASSIELAQTLLKSSKSYDDYKAAMEKASLSSEMYTEQQWEAYKAMERSSAMSRFLKDDMIEMAAGIDTATASNEDLIERATELYEQYQDVKRTIEDINKEMQRWKEQVGSIVASELNQWFSDVSRNANSLQSEIQRLNEEIAKNKEKLRVTTEEDDRKRLQERIKELQSELAEKTKELTQAQTNLEQSTIRYEAALAMVDEVLGTNYYATYQLEKGVKNLVDQYTRTGDLDAFRAGLEKIRDEGLAPMKSALEDAVTKAQDLYNKLMELPKDILIRIRFDKEPFPTLPQQPATVTPQTYTPLPNNPGAYPIPKQTGGIVYPNRPYLVGERGKEIFVPNQTGYIYPNNQLNPISITVNAQIAEEIDIYRLTDQLANLIRKSNREGRFALA